MAALHDACQALYDGECKAAIVAGANLIFTPTISTTLSDYRAMASDGICKTFDAAADGYGRGEAVNAILIKRLDHAIQDGDPVRAVIRATALNCDGRQEAQGAPKARTQEEVIRDAYARAGIEEFSRTAFFECHGTGTQKGDLAEVTAIKNVFEKGIMIGAVWQPLSSWLSLTLTDRPTGETQCWACRGRFSYYKPHKSDFSVRAQASTPQHPC
jgi:acyl transferase domain-containing protein